MSQSAKQEARPGLAAVISGPSGAGKTSVCNRLIERHGYLFSVSTTTRPPRADETDGVEYRFCARDAFLRRVERGEFLEYSEHFDNLYGTPAGPVMQALKEGRTILLEIDVNGARQVMERLPTAYFIFLVAPDMDETERRLRNRHSDSEAAVRTRLERAEMEMAMKVHDARIVINDDLERAVEEVHALIQKAEARRANEGRSA